MSFFDFIEVGSFFDRFVKDCDGYDEGEHIFQFNDVKLTTEFLLISGLEDKEYSSVSFLLDEPEPEVVVFENRNDGEGDRVVFSALIECYLKLKEKQK